jgi:hypothetical protein
MDAADIPAPTWPIPGSMLMAGVSKHYVTISGPTAKVIMSTRDARALMGWLYDCLPAECAATPRMQFKIGLETPLHERIGLRRLEMRTRVESMSYLRRLRQEARA